MNRITAGNGPNCIIISEILWDGSVSGSSPYNISTASVKLDGTREARPRSRDKYLRHDKTRFMGGVHEVTRINGAIKFLVGGQAPALLTLMTA